MAVVACLFFFNIYKLELNYERIIPEDNAPPITQQQRGRGSSSRHPDWKLWNDMSPLEQEEALERAFGRAKPYGTMLGNVGTGHEIRKLSSVYHNQCADGKKPTLFGTGGEHMVCGPQPTNGECHYLSFGIRDDPSFDNEFAKAWNCRGFAGDPSVDHPSHLNPLVTFHNIGLTMLRPTYRDRKIDPKDDWILASLPQVRELVGWDYLDLIKMDCEGCEVSMARDILAEDPSFLDKVGQISIETHATRTWVNSTEELYYYALMFPLLEDAGFKLIWTSVFGCGKYEHDGCMPEMSEKMNMTCGNRRRSAANYVPIGWSCHDWLWARI